MKKMMMIAAMMVAVLSASAQEAGQFFAKPMVGGTFTNVTGGDDTKMKVGAIGGVEFGYMASDKFGLTAGLLYMMQGNKVEDDLDGTIKNNLEYINLPVLANFYVVPTFALKVGVQAGYLTKAKSDDYSFRSECNKFDLSIPFGIAYESKDGFCIEARYNLGLTNVIKKEVVDKSNHNSVIMVTLGYKIPF
jgi:hypothetical protein